MKIIVQFSDSSNTTVIAYLCCWQDEEFYPNQQEIDSSDQRWHSFYYAIPEMMRESLPVPD